MKLEECLRRLQSKNVWYTYLISLFHFIIAVISAIAIYVIY